MRTLARFLCPIAFTYLFLMSGVRAQECVLKIGAWKSHPEEITNNMGRTRMRKATVVEFASTARNTATQRLYKGVSLMGYAYFEKLPEGSYLITVRKAGFKTTKQSHQFSCNDATDGFDFVDVLVFRGNPGEIVNRGEVFTVRGDRDYSGSEPLPPVYGDTPKQISGGVLNGKALVLPKPAYPPAAKVVRASGLVSVQVLIDEDGNVVSAYPVCGHPLLRSAAKAAALEAKFSPTTLQGNPVKVSGVITYNFVAPSEKPNR